jgi:hypothetical protein
MNDVRGGVVVREEEIVAHVHEYGVLRVIPSRAVAAGISHGDVLENEAHFGGRRQMRGGQGKEKAEERKNLFHGEAPVFLLT